jgi:hypothetical protein
MWLRTIYGVDFFVRIGVILHCSLYLKCVALHVYCNVFVILCLLYDRRIQWPRHLAAERVLNNRVRAVHSV